MAFLEDFQIYQENWILENDRSPGGLWNSKNLIFQKSAKEDKNMHFSEIPYGREIVEITLQNCYYFSMNDIDWKEIWKTHSPFYRDGKFLLELSNGSTVEFVPGPAFGDGSHPTTNLVLEQIAPLVGAKVVVDLGAGSGILSLAAAKYGAKEVFALEIDPPAIKTLHQNILLNDLSNIRVNKAPKSFDVVLLNMISSEQEIALQSHKYLLQQGKTYVVSGILQKEVETTLQRLCLKDVINLSFSGDWACIVAQS